MIVRRKVKLWGVTLTELLVVISIIVLLLSVVLWYFRSQIFKGNDAKRKGDLHKIQVAVEEYEKDNNCYPLPQLVVCDPGDGLKPYISKIACDPSTDSSYYYDHEDSLCPSWYRIYTNLENTTDTDIKGACGPGYSFNYYVTSPNAPEPSCILIEGSGTGDDGSGGTGGSGDGGTGDGSGDGGGETTENFYGCFTGVCLSITWDPSRPGPECDPNYGNSTCYGQCIDSETGQPQNECESWGH
jgi:type II secretory pathway pseudopilin PulG